MKPMENKQTAVKLTTHYADDEVWYYELKHEFKDFIFEICMYDDKDQDDERVMDFSITNKNPHHHPIRFFFKNKNGKVKFAVDSSGDNGSSYRTGEDWEQISDFADSFKRLFNS
jgi:hypothetical protein